MFVCFFKSYGLRVPSSPCPLFSRYNVPQFSMFPVGPTFAGSSVLMVPLLSGWKVLKVFYCPCPVFPGSYVHSLFFQGSQVPVV